MNRRGFRVGVESLEERQLLSSINEIRIDQPSTDVDEYFEIAGTAGESLNDLTYIVIGDGAGGSGVIENVTSLSGQSIDSSGFFVVAESTFTLGTADLTRSLNFENGDNVTHLLVTNFSGTDGQDLDTNDDGVLDLTPWTAIVDSVALVATIGSGDRVYSPNVVGPDGSFVPGHVYRNPDQTGPFAIGPFAGGSDTPGQANVPSGPLQLTIAQIQGPGHVSPHVGQQVSTTGIVTAVDTNGFYLQDPVGDGNLATSEGIFVFTGSSPTVVAGNALTIVAVVSEFTPGGVATRNLSSTQLISPSITINSSGNPIPAATSIGLDGGGVGRIPPNQSIDDDAFASFQPELDGIDFFESLEAMLVIVREPAVINGTNAFGEIFTVVNAGASATGLSLRGTLNISPDDFNPERVQLQFDSGLLPFTLQVNVGDLLSDVTGVVDYSFGNFEVKVTQPFTSVPGGLTAETTTVQKDGAQLTIMSYNVLNLDPAVEASGQVDDDLGNGRFTAIATQIVWNLSSPDIIALQEIQDNTGGTTDGTTAADQTLQMLVNAIQAVGGPTYTYLDNPFIGNNTNGGQPGGNIRTAFLYNPARVSLEGALQTVTDPTDQQTNPGNPFYNARLPLVATFRFNGQDVTVVNNHFSSKGGSAPILGVEQPFESRQEEVAVNGSLDERQAQAASVKAFVDGILAANPNANIVVLGDLNEFEFVSPVLLLEQSLTNLTNTLPANERYSFIFQGNSQSLDHILVSDNLAGASSFDIVHVNTEFADSPQRASDHDPLVVGLSLPGVATAGDAVRFATFNASLNRGAEGQLVADLTTTTNAQARTVAEIIQRVRPDVVLINEFDYEATQTAPSLFQQNYLAISQNGAAPIAYPYVYYAPSNTGLPSGFDLDNNGVVANTPGSAAFAGDAFGFGFFPGQFGMLLLSMHPIQTDGVRTFQEFLWKDMPGALLPDDPSTLTPADFYSPEELAVFRLSSKSHWDVPILVDGKTIHVLASHPTPPVFDGPEDRNGTRNHDEIRFWADYVTPGQGGYIYDDLGNDGGLQPGASFVLLGDMNADPNDGDSTSSAILQLLNNPAFNTSVIPDSPGGPDASQRQGGANLTHLSDPAYDTADFADGSPGNLRADYVLPSHNLGIVDSGVFWPRNEDALFHLVGDFPFPSSDHRLVYADLATTADRRTVAGIDFLGEATFPTGTTFEGTVVGGLSGLAYDPATGTYLAISDDRSQLNPARYYGLGIDLSDGTLDPGDVAFQSVTTLLDASGQPFAPLSLDPEGIALLPDGRLFIASEGDANQLINPFVNWFMASTGQQLDALPVDTKYLPTASKVSGIRNNLAFESLTISPDNRFLYVATENALYQDGPAASLDDESPARIIKYDLSTGMPVAEYSYVTETVADPAIPPGSFATNGLVELLSIDTSGTLLALERSFSNGVGNAIRLYEVRTQSAVDISPLFGIDGSEADPPAEKRLILDFADLGLPLDNIEGMAFGPTLPDGRQSFIVVSDNNFSPTQFTQFLAFAIDLNAIPLASPTVETPAVIDSDTAPAGVTQGDADDPAIWVHPTNASQSLVFTALKDGGLQVYDLSGQVKQSITPKPNKVFRYNNIDVIYNFPLGKKSSPVGKSKTVDIAVVSDRENDTIAIFSIDPRDGKLREITGNINGGQPLFAGDGEATAYGLTAFRSPLTGTSYAFVTQADGNQVAQLELSYGPGNKISAEVVRTLVLPIPAGGELEDAQAEAMVVDREAGLLYVAQEGVGIWKFHAEPGVSDSGVLIQPIADDDAPDGTGIKADVEGLTIYYAANGMGYLLASSQGDHTYAVYSREGDNSYLGSFGVGPHAGIDSAEETDGTDVINVPLGPEFPFGLLVVQDGNNDPQFLINDDGELENSSGNFKFVPWQNVATAFPTPLAIDTQSYNPRELAAPVIRGVASGDTDQNSTVLWVSASYAADVEFVVATDAAFQNVVATRNGVIGGPLLPFKVEVDGLSPHTHYDYKVIVGGVLTAAGQFQTAAEPTSLQGLRFGVSGDWRGELAPYPAVSNAADAELEFFIALGDTIYADYPSPALPSPQAQTLDEYRIKQNEVYDRRLGLNTLGDLRASTSILATIDDHEVTNDFSGGAPIASDPRFDGDPTALINDSALYEAGLQAFQEFNPVNDEFYGDTGEERTAFERKLYRSRSYGLDAGVFVLDARSFRDQELPGVANPLDPAEVGAFLVASFDPTRTMLGQVQIDELKADLLASQQAGTTWKFVVVPEPIQNFGVVGAADRFEGYAAERTALLQFIDQNQIENVVFIAADIHGTVVNNLTYQISPGSPQIATSAFEVSTGAVAFDAPFGPTVVDLAAAANLIDPATLAFYQALPVANDADSIPNDKDDLVKGLVNQQLASLGYDPVGLNQNLPIADGLIDAVLLQGDYLATHTYGWTQFDIDPATQALTVTTYGIAPYTEAELQGNPAGVVNRVPMIVSQFRVQPAATPPPLVPSAVSALFNQEEPDLDYSRKAAVVEGIIDRFLVEDVMSTEAEQSASVPISQSGLIFFVPPETTPPPTSAVAKRKAKGAKS